MTNFGSFVIMTSQSEERITHLLMTHLEVQIHHFPNTAERTEIFQIYNFRNIDKGNYFNFAGENKVDLWIISYH